MRFGQIATAEAEGAVLAHSLHHPGLAFKKGRRLSAEDVQALLEKGVSDVTAAVFEPGDVQEDEAADRLATVITDPSLRLGKSFTGRANLFAEADGVLLLDVEAIDRINLQHEAITIGTLPNHAVVGAGDMVATVKIIPFATPEDVLTHCVEIARETIEQRGPLVRVAPFTPKAIRLIQTRLEGTAAKMLDKTVRITAERAEGVGGRLIGEARCAHEVAPLVGEIHRAVESGFDILLIAGASAITDRGDVLPAAVAAAGGRLLHFGMPVDPGNLLLLAEIEGRTVLGLPGCARSPKLNGFDWVLQRLAADIPVGPEDIMRMGIGGLLAEIPSRPQPRRGREVERAGPPKIAAIVLAAGQSRRMGGPNKLLAELDGKPVVAHAVDAAVAAKLANVIVVTGHEHKQVIRALTGRKARFVHNERFAEGLSTSLRAGLDALPEDIDGVMVCLGDMPLVTAELLSRLVAAFNPTEGRGIVVPTRRGKRGNPVLWGSAFFEAMRGQEGDVGARALIGANAEAVVEVEVENDASLTDVDTPEALEALLRMTAPALEGSTA
jgi:molybdenum cofactor cytidylyltransferase